jgi:hypothetical protein
MPDILSEPRYLGEIAGKQDTRTGHACLSDAILLVYPATPFRWFHCAHRWRK